MERERKKALLEAILFVSGHPVTLKDLRKATGFSTGEIGFLMKELAAEYRERRGGILLAEVAEGFQLVSNPEFSVQLRKLSAVPAQRLSMAALETLAIIAYRQPLTKAELDELRGVNSDGVLRGLLERRLIRVVGKKESPGRPLLYGTTREFLRFFGLKDLSELPDVKELNPDAL